jgi:hypothetical protein
VVLGVRIEPDLGDGRIPEQAIDELRHHRCAEPLPETVTVGQKLVDAPHTGTRVVGIPAGYRPSAIRLDVADRLAVQRREVRMRRVLSGDARQVLLAHFVERALGSPRVPEVRPVEPLQEHRQVRLPE